MNLLAQNRNNHFPELLSPFFSDSRLSDERNQNGPLTNIIQNKEDYKIEMMAPGRSKSDFKIDLEKDELIVNYEKKESEDNDGKYTRREFELASFTKTFNLQNNMFEKEKIEANYQDGVLSIKLPLLKEAQAVNKRIQIS